MKTKQFDKSNLKTFRSEVEKALAIVGKKYGVGFNFGNITYDPNEWHTKLTCTIADPKLGKNVDPALLKYANNVRKHGWKMDVSESDLGKVVKLGNRGMCEFVGCKDRNSRMPLIFQAEDGKLINAATSYLPRG